MKYKFFTGPKCSGCEQVKNLIDSFGRLNEFEFIDVEKEAALAYDYRVRSLPTIVSSGFNFYVGAKDCTNFVKKLYSH